ncbi:YkyA family protein [Paenibacillus barcinonensis]|uniref:Putative cell-wall binding lipoprotein n=1 Tax=Paenibacillus barcinonensis TaxID=198119 RepID=A0A2V4V8C9_PAEBA|nr:YkyA family protein [Paenibacillus barcinonensis]PYE49055.1 putative cell-wall binding lipoprotein [Paenibacillus barcinonensis]QKS55305.1 YkyA family protein [Paenibacillus barcinonensis]
MNIIGKKLTHAVLITVFLLLLNGCGESQEPAVNQINHLAQNSQEIDKALASLSNHEQEDMKLYNSILRQGKEKNSNVTGYLDQVETHIQARRTILEQIEIARQKTDEQTKSLQQSLLKLSFEKEETLALAGKALEQFESRNQTLQMFIEAYELGLEAEEQVYGSMRGRTKTNLKEIKLAIQKRNVLYDKLTEIQEKFNLLTQTFNNTQEQLMKLSHFY